LTRLDIYLGRSFLYSLLLTEALLLVATWVLPGLRDLPLALRLGLHHLALPLLALAAAYGLALQLKSRSEWTGLLAQGRSPLLLFRSVPVICLLVWLMGSLVPAMGATDKDLETRFLHLEAAQAFSGSRGLISYERRKGSRLHRVLYCAHGSAPQEYASVEFQIDAAGKLRFRHGEEWLPDLGIRHSRPDRELRSRILGRPALLSLFSRTGLPYHGLHLLLCLLLPLLAIGLSLRFGLPLGHPLGYVLPLLVPTVLLVSAFLILALQASGQLF
jgi:hypothetical protein